MNRIALLLLIVSGSLFSCSKDDPPLPDNVAQFETSQQGIEAGTNETTIKVKLSRAVEASTDLTLTLKENGIAYNTQYTTTPAPVDGTLKLTIAAGSSETSFKIKKAAEIVLTGDESIELTIKSASNSVLVGQTTKLTLKFSPILSQGTSLTLDGGEGGSSAINSVFVDMSGNVMTPVSRKSWDLGFYNGAANRVIINYAAAHTILATTKNDINAVKAADVNLPDFVIGQGNGKMSVIDDLSGDLTKTVIAEISATDADNKVYVVSRAGSAPSAPDPATLIKIRILRSANGYVLQHAKLNDDNFQTVNITKNTTTNFNFISYENGAVSYEPAADRWDFQWTYAMYTTKNGADDVPYPFSDLVFINNNSGVQAAKVLNSTVTYDNYNESNVASTTFSGAARDVIGASWRLTKPENGMGIGILKDHFYVIKDKAGNVYKLKFISFHSAAIDGGTRGKPKLEYKLVKKGA